MPKSPKPQFYSFRKFLFHSMNRDLWLGILLVLITIPITLFIPENTLESNNGFLISLGVVRLIFGIIFIIFIPGYATFNILWPNNEKEDLTRYGVSFGLSLAIVPIIGLILNFTPYGVTFFSIVITVTLFTLIGLCIIFLRRFKNISENKIKQ